MMNKLSFILTAAIIILSGTNCVLYFMGGNILPAVIWGIIALLNLVAIVLRIKQKK